MAENPEATREMILLEKIENDPNVTQASLATQLGRGSWHGELAYQAHDRQGICEGKAR